MCCLQLRSCLQYSSAKKYFVKNNVFSKMSSCLCETMRCVLLPLLVLLLGTASEAPQSATIHFSSETGHGKALQGETEHMNTEYE